MRQHSKKTAPERKPFPGAVLHHLLLGMMVLYLLSAPAFAGDERFDYDPLGRLIRVIDEDGRVTAYTYDPAGNILQVIAGDADQTPPIVTSVSPDFVRAGTSREFRFSGTGLLSATVSTADAGLTAAVIAASASELTVRVTAAIDASPGPRAITVSNAAGSTAAAISVRPALTISIVPSHIVIPPDSVARPLAIRISDTEPESVTLKLTVSDPALVSVSQDSIVLESGQTAAQLIITGLQTGRAFLGVSSPALSQAAKSPIIVNNDALSRSAPLGVFVPAPPFQNIQDLVSPDLGVFVQQSSFQNVSDLAGPDVGVFVQTSSSFENIDNLTSPDLGVFVQQSSSSVVNDLTSELVGVVSGSPEIVSLSPTAANPGDVFTLSVNGINFFDASAVIVEPADGITFTSVPSVTPEGMRLTIDVSIDVAATAGARVIRVVTPRGTSTSTPTTGNTLTINAP